MKFDFKHIFCYTMMTLLLSLSVLADSQVPIEAKISLRAKMLDQLSSGDWILQAEALDYLGRNKVTESLPAVQKILAQKKSPWIRGRAFMALTKITPERAAQLAQTYMKDPHAPVKVTVAKLCANLPTKTADPIIAELLKQSGQVHFYALLAHAKHHGQATWKLAEKSLGEIPNDSLEAAVRTMALIGNEAALVKINALVKQGKSLPLILSGLKGVNNSALIPVYFDLINTPKGKISIIDIWQALKIYQHDVLITACETVFSSGNKDHVKVVAQLMSRYLKDPKLGKGLKEALLKITDHQTLLLGLSALSCLEADRYKDFFISNLKHEKTEIRSFSIRCLGQCKTVNLYETLQNSLSDPQSRVRVAALDSLKRADSESVPVKEIVGYFKTSLLSTDKLTRKSAIAVISPYINTDNGESALVVMKEMLKLYGSEGIHPYMKAIFRMIPEEKSALALEALGYVVHWHIMGAFPTDWASPGKDEKGMDVVYPPEKKVDLKQTIKVKYNSKYDLRFGKKVAEEEITWVKATAANEDAVLYMTKAGRSQLIMPRKHGVCYAYTEITISKKSEVNLQFLMNMKALDKVWLNGKLISLKAVIDSRKGTATKTVKTILNAGKNRLLVKIESKDTAGIWWAQKVSTRGFSLSIRDLKGKPMKWSHQ
jgi:HEAT repeat protein